MLHPDMLLMLYNVGIVGVSNTVGGRLLWEEGIGLRVWWPEMDGGFMLL